MSIGVLKSICVDFSDESLYQYITVFSEEIYSRTIEITPLNNGDEYVIPIGTTARLEARKPDNKPILLDAKIDFTNNKIYLELTPRCIDTPGITSCQIGLYGVDNRFIASSYFYIDVYRSALSGNGSVNHMGCNNNVVESSPEYQSFRVALLSVDEVQKRANMAIEQINENAENANQATASANEAAERANTGAKNAENAALKASSTEEKISENENARIAAENVRLSSEEIRASAEETRKGNETVRVANEEARISAEAERVRAEQDRITEEENRKTAERERVTAESARSKAEEARLSAEKERVSAETARKSAETVRSDKENIRIENENARVANETARKTNETGRVNNEDTRKANETSRIVAENVRLSSEEIRASAEDIREGNETVRVANENARISAETARKAEFDTWSSEVGKISAFDKRISNIEAAVMPELVIPTVDKTVAHRKDVPENVLPFASINEIGGMSYKCNNLIPFPYTKNGAEKDGTKLFVNEDGGITGSGTPTSAISFSLADKIELPEGTYTLSTQGTFANILVQIDVYNANGETTLSNATKNSIVFTAEKNDCVRILVKCGVNGEAMSGTVYPMLNTGDIALPYEPYFTGLRDAKVTAIESEGRSRFPASVVYGSWATEVTKDGRNCYRFITNNNRQFAPITFKENTQYTVRFDACAVKIESAANSNDWPFVFIYTDNTREQISCVADGKWETITKTSAAGKTIKTIGIVTNEYRINNYIDIDSFIFVEGTEIPDGTKPYFKNTFPIPEEVQALDGYGQGVNAEYHNKIVLDPASGVKKFVKNTERIVLDGTENWSVAHTQTGVQDIRYDSNLTGKNAKNNEVISSHFSYNGTNVKGIWVTPSKDKDILSCRIQWEFETVNDLKTYLAEQYAAGTPVTFEYVLANPIETDIGEYVSDDNFIGVESGGTATAVNEHEYDVPFEVEYIVKGGGTDE